jgi:K+-sensing histidine kinase KdpD
MDVRAVIVGSTWFAIMLISLAFLGIGGVNLSTSIAVGILIFVAFIVTFAVAFGLQAHQAQLDRENPSTKALAQMSAELTAMRSMVNDLAKKVDAIQKELEE